MSEHRFLQVLTIVYQGLNLIAKGIKKIIDEIKDEMTKEDK